VRKVPVRTALEAAALIPDGAVVSVSSSSALGCPDTVLAGIGERFARHGSPHGLTTVHPIAAGDMYGVAGIDHLARPGLLARVVAGSYPSGPSSAEPPRIWQMIEAGEVEAYNLPSGVLFQMHRAGATGQPGVLSEVGLDTFVDPRHDGGRMNARITEDLSRPALRRRRRQRARPGAGPPGRHRVHRNQDRAAADRRARRPMAHTPTPRR
jgi:propionate CoA-transferase